MFTPEGNTTKILPIDISKIEFADSPEAISPVLPALPDPNTLALQEAADIIKTESAPIAFPTETVYGLGASALSTDAVRGIFAAKNRPSDNPLIVHISSIDQLRRVLKTEIPQVYKPLVEAFWPGPLTIILPLPTSGGATPVISPACTPGQSTFGVRMPAHKVARALIALSDLPLAAPSANASTRPSPTTAQHVYTDMKGRIPLILDGGPCGVGVESTVVDGTVFPPKILRPGGVSAEMIRKAGGLAWEGVISGPSEAKDNESVRTPGMKYRHYSPTTKVVLVVGDHDGSLISSSLITSAALASSFQHFKVVVLTASSFDLSKWPSSVKTYITRVIPLGTDRPSIARNLFAALRDADENSGDIDLILVEGIDDADEGLAIMNRLRKAASEIYEQGRKVK
ncbi:DHBP synthase RibB-like alpha/beta domain-containing protein [Lipomyces oligophaga]|uniref:DHBP synthase RibB-like alpha/beta domain-containing protein n=1 Tax=Lipomyces oligophaga TaxID=45792 RepID=UPI0034CDA3EB